MRLRLKATHYAIVAFHAAVLLDTCYYCRSAGSVDELAELLALLRGTSGGGDGPSPAGVLRAVLFWGLVAAAFGLYLAAGTSDPGYVPWSLGPQEALDSRLELAEAPSEGLLGQAAVPPAAGSLGPHGGSARDVAMKTTPGGVSYVYDEEEADEEAGSGPEARTAAAQQASALPAAAAVAALGGAAVALGGLGLAGSARGPDLDEAAGEAAEGEGFAFRALGDGPAEEPPCKLCRCALPLRAKHCFECGRCVRTHDHHCPWIANCVGERNRALFFWFVALQGAEAWWLLAQQGRCLGSEAAGSGLFIAALVLVALFAFCLGSLSLCHAWLMATNLTTWEYLRWRRIPYLRALAPEGGSPFSTSLAGNVAIYCLGGGCGRPVELLRLALRRPRLGAAGARLARWLDAPRSPEGYSGGRMAATGEIAWQVGAQHVPCLVRNRCYSCYFPPGHG